MHGFVKVISPLYYMLLIIATLSYIGTGLGMPGLVRLGMDLIVFIGVIIGEGFTPR